MSRISSVLIHQPMQVCNKLFDDLHEDIGKIAAEQSIEAICTLLEAIASVTEHASTMQS